MKRIYFFWVLFAEAVGGIAGFLTREDVKIYAESIVKPPYSPPAVVFPVVWGILYALMGISAARVYVSPESPDRTKGLRLFLLQLGINFVWCFVFFTFRAYMWGAVLVAVMFVLVAWMAMCFKRVDVLSSYLQVPYLVWLMIAEYLSLGVWYLN
ncbi:MAG: tryptophan-rich sensory protein [Synergistaceae bacterium]|nr:tryptophan-rich sensory protein [Synergistaceae bacterium]